MAVPCQKRSDKYRTKLWQQTQTPEVTYHYEQISYIFFSWATEQKINYSGAVSNRPKWRSLHRTGRRCILGVRAKIFDGSEKIWGEGERNKGCTQVYSEDKATHPNVQETGQKGDLRSTALVFDMPNLNVCVFKVLFKAPTFVYLLHQTGATALIDTSNGNPSACRPSALRRAAVRACPQSLPQTQDTYMVLFEETK